MFFFLFLILLFSNYVAASTMSKESKTVYFTVVSVVVLGWFILSMLGVF